MTQRKRSERSVQGTGQHHEQRQAPGAGGGRLALRRGQAPAGGVRALTSTMPGVTAWAGGEPSHARMVGAWGYDDQHTNQGKCHVA